MKAMGYYLVIGFSHVVFLLHNTLDFRIAGSSRHNRPFFISFSREIVWR